jgi:hypothetical protein
MVESAIVLGTTAHTWWLAAQVGEEVRAYLTTLEGAARDKNQALVNLDRVSCLGALWRLHEALLYRPWLTLCRPGGLPGCLDARQHPVSHSLPTLCCQVRALVRDRLGDAPPLSQAGPTPAAPRGAGRGAAGRSTTHGPGGSTGLSSRVAAPAGAAGGREFDAVSMVSAVGTSRTRASQVTPSCRVAATQLPGSCHPAAG